MYYLRSRPAADPIKFTVDVEALLKEAGEIIPEDEVDVMKERRDNTILEGENGSLKKFKPNVSEKEQKEQKEEEVKACPMRRKGAPIDEECMACGS